MRADVAVLVSLAAVSCTPSPPQPPEPDGPPVTVSQDTVPQDTILKPASLVRRLAEAADGFRDGNLRFVVAAREFPHKVAGVFLSKSEADSAAQANSSGTLHFATFGPYRTEADLEVSAEVDDVDSVVAYYGDGEKKTYDGKVYDALFWSLPAFDKFVVPYITSVAGADEAQSRREAYRSGDLTESALPHRRHSF